MATTTSYRSCTHTQRLAAFLTATVIFLAWGSLTPARGQCDPNILGKLTAIDATAADLFGYSVAVDGDTAVVGANNDTHAGGTNAGSAYVYFRVGGEWSQQAKLTASDAAMDDKFGWSVSLSGDTALVGSYGDDHAGGTDAGSAYVFTRTGTVWTQQAKLTASDAAADDNFGVSVALFGNTAVVGAWHDDHAGGTDAGSAYVFTRSGTVWTQQATLTASDAAAIDRFGYSVSLAGDAALIGAYTDDHAGGTDAGSAYVFARGGTVWTQQAKLTASDAAASDNFGISVALSGDTAVVGALYDDNAGSAYVFVGACGAWTQQAKLTASDAAAGDNFGVSVALFGDTVVVGASYDDHAGGTDAGSAYEFFRFFGGSWIQQAKLTAAADAATFDLFGNSVAIYGETAVVGAYFDTHAGGSLAGSAYIFPAVRCDSDDDGVADVDDVCPNNSPGLPVDCAGRPLRDCNNDCLLNGLDIQCITDEMLNQ